MDDKRRIQKRERRRGRSSLTDRTILLPALADSFKKLDPRRMARNPVMFVVEVGSVITTVIFVLDLFNGTPGFSGANNELFVGQITVWLGLTARFANFADAAADGRRKAAAVAPPPTANPTNPSPLRRRHNERDCSNTLTE